ncbi:Rha family transcriptional regulator [Parabacteroides chongii]|uniref:Rha family transcriptional regulator n=1 Tax=Parabacteroides chongii TaxID=2685834 RepID=UPI00240D8DC6|nr:Rha family transcriptional regulator [Parabacteroides chongii]WFE84956.1 Rha family transcriptional regulator [Parabacteroides chongii]
MKELNLFPVSSNELVKVENNQVVTTSLKVAEFFNKRHSDVLRAIKNLECTQQFQQRNFALMVEMKELPQGGATKCEYYYLTRDGFTFLAMGFTGKIAAKFKEAYINAFNEMEELLRTGKESKYAEQIFKKYIEDFNKKLQRSIKAGKKKHGEYYGGAGDMLPYIPYYDRMSFEANIRNVFAFVNNSYLESMYFISQLFKKEKELESIKKSIARFTYEIESKTGIY